MVQRPPPRGSECLIYENSYWPGQHHIGHGAISAVEGLPPCGWRRGQECPECQIHRLVRHDAIRLIRRRSAAARVNGQQERILAWAKPGAKVATKWRPRVVKMRRRHPPIGIHRPEERHAVEPCGSLPQPREAISGPVGILWIRLVLVHRFPFGLLALVP